LATDATGTPTSLGIPKYNTAVDAPSGLGFNATMDALDTILVAMPQKPAGIVTGEAVIWNGSAWVRSSVTKLGLASIAQGGATTDQVIAWNGSTWAAADGGASVARGTTLPVSPADDEEYILVDSTTAPTYAWRFRYDTAVSGSNKWEFVGGAPAFDLVATAESTTSTSYTNLSTTGPSIVVPRAGEYLIAHGAFIDKTGGTLGTGYMSYAIGATAAAEADRITMETGDAGTTPSASLTRTNLKTFAASDDIVAKYKVTSGPDTFAYSERWMTILPVRVA
jgi:hypothetical protein